MKRIASTAIACLFFLALASPVFAQGTETKEGKAQEEADVMQGGHMYQMNPEMMQQCRKAHEEYAKNLASVRAQIEQSKNQKNTDKRLDSLTAALDTLVKTMETRQQGCPAAQCMKHGAGGMMHQGQGMMNEGQSMMQGGSHHQATGNM